MVDYSSQFFDFDALDEFKELDAPGLEAEEASSASLSVPTAAAEDSEESDNEDSLSEVWPGDIMGDDPLASLDPGPPPDAAAAERRPEGDVRLYEVVISRAVVRSEPRLEATVAGICSLRELIPAVDDSSFPHWVRLVNGRGYILKDGRQKDPKLGLLLQPYELKGIPPHFLSRAHRLLCDVWTEARSHQPFLKPPLVRNLRRAADQALEEGIKRGGTFDTEAFEEVFMREAHELLNAENQPTPPAQGAQMGAGSGAPKWSYEGASVQATAGVTPVFVRKLLADLRDRHPRLPSQEDVATILSQAALLCSQLPSLVFLRVPAGATLHIVGDIHGQFWDFLKILRTYGDPSPTNMYLFNGDFVDRGKFSVEVAIALLAMKVSSPGSVHLNRGNHESVRMNAIYGFMAEVKDKYNEAIFELFCQAFRCLPLATVVNDSVFVVHGGLGAAEGVKLDDVTRLAREKEPDENADELMLELLWSDPMDSPGIRKSPRGGGVLFGPDVTRRFCGDNGLVCVVRSHEMKQEGFEWHHNQMCLTVFSAPNYCGICGNRGAVCDVTPRRGQPKLTASDLKVCTFDATDRPF